jgi:co-chaperonin GroES (HSP10)
MRMWFPMNDRLFVQRLDEPGQSVIVIPEKYREGTHIGRVLAVGPGKWVEGVNGDMVRATPDVKPGMLIAFGRFTDWDDEGCVLIQEADVMFVMDEPVKIGIEHFTDGEVGVDRV